MGKNVMVVDDDRSIGETVRIILEDQGYSVSVVGSGRECIDMLLAGFSGMVLMDVMMPEMGGWDTISEIVERGLAENIMIVMLTAMHDPSPQLERLTKYVVDYVRKPFTEKELIEVVAASCP